MTQREDRQLAAGLFGPILRHKGKVIAFFLVVLIGVGLGTFLAPRTYESQAKLLVRLGRENATLDATAVQGQSPVVALPPSRDNDINTIVEVLHSRNLIEKVVDRVGASAILGDTPYEGGDQKPKAADTATRYKAVKLLSRRLNVDARKKSNVVVLSYRGYSPELARAVLSSLLEQYLKKHIELNRSPKSESFFAEQVERLRKALAASQQSLLAFQNKSGLIIPKGEEKLLAEQVAKIELELIHTKAALAAAEYEQKMLAAKLKTLKPTVVTAHAKGMSNEAADNMRSQLYALQLKELELLAKYPAEHPNVRMLRKQIQEAQAILSKESKSREQITTGPNRLYQETELALLKAEPLAAGLRAKKDVLEKQLNQLKSHYEDMPKMAELQQQVDLQQNHLKSYSESLEQAKIDQALSSERISNIAVFQPPTLDIVPVSPRRALNMLLGLIFAAGGAAALAWLADYQSAQRNGPGETQQKPNKPENPNT